MLKEEWDYHKPTKQESSFSPVTYHTASDVLLYTESRNVWPLKLTSGHAMGIFPDMLG
jgi:hypothetical protein